METETRLKRKNREDILYKSSGGITDAIDNFVKEVWRINDSEYDFICAHGDDDDLDSLMLIFEDSLTFIQKKIAISTINKCIDKYNSQ